MKNIKKITLKSIKLAVGSLVAILIANWLGLEYATSAAVITILSVLNTKKATLFVAGKRILAFILAVLLALIVFNLFGYDTIGFVIFIFLFSGICYILNIEEGIPMNTVLVSHFLIEKSMEPSLIINEAGLFFIGILCGILVNLYMPKKLKIFFENKEIIETQLKELIYDLAVFIENPKEEHQIEVKINELKRKLDKSIKVSYDNAQNTLTKDMGYFIHYMTMREKQVEILFNLYKLCKRLDMVPKQSKEIANFIKDISVDYSETNNGVKLSEDLTQIKKSMEEEELPKSRKEFENRAILFHILFLLENFLLIKKEFVEELDQETMNRFWNE